MSKAGESGTVYTTTVAPRREADSAKIFHTDEDCSHLQRAKNATSRPRDALINGWKLCDTCAGNHRNGDPGSIDCPRCGRECTNLPQHIRGCDP